MERRLAAILAADVVGYSRLMGQDEAGTLQALKAIRSEVIDPRIADHKGRVFKSTGDGVLVEFPSVVNAVACAVDIQRAMAGQSSDLLDDRAVRLRIGVNLGDVIVEGEDVFGDGVNVAARLEGIAPPGAIAISGTVRDHLGNRLDLQFEDMGEQALRNIASPVRVYRLSLGRQAERAPAPVSEKPSIAVLPFTNMSGDPEQEYFSDGLAEDIITELSRFRSLFVIARNSSFTYKGKSVKIETVGRELGVAFVLEGSVRRINDRVRVTAQLINASAGNHVWAERYDRKVDDLFAIQDEVVRSIVGTIEGRLSKDIAERIRTKPKAGMAAYEYILQARQHLNQYDAAAAEPWLRHALALDPSYAQAYAWLAMVHWLKFFDDNETTSIDEAVALARKAVVLDDSDSVCHMQLAFSYLFQRQFEMADIHSRRALEINPSNMLALAVRAHWLCRTGQAYAALEALDEVLRYDPYPADWFWENKAICYLAVGRFADSIASTMRKSQLFWWDHCYLGACLAQLDQLDAAKSEIALAVKQFPKASVGSLMKGEPYKNDADAKALADALRKAGLPERPPTGREPSN